MSQTRDIDVDAGALDRQALVQLAKRLDVPAVGRTPALVKAVKARQKELATERDAATAEQTPAAGASSSDRKPVDVPEGVVPGETPGWPVDASTGDPLDLTDEQRQELAAADLAEHSTGAPDDAVAAAAALAQSATEQLQDAPAAGERVAIARTTPSAWWCPVCDHSQPHGFPHCAKCRSERDGDEVIVHAAA